MTTTGNYTIHLNGTREASIIRDHDGMEVIITGHEVATIEGQEASDLDQWFDELFAEED